MSLFTLGTMRALGSADQLQAVLAAALDAGINHIETAPAYGPAERFLGQVLGKLQRSCSARRDGLVITSKILPGPDLAQGQVQLRGSLERLGLARLDNLAVHGLNTPEHLDWALRGAGAELLAWALGGALVGAVLASTGATLPAAEVLAALAIAVVALLSLLAARRQQGGAGFLPASVAAPVVGLAVAVHAQLHGLEAPHDGSSLLWWTGALASSVLVAGGSFLLLRRQPTLRSGAAAALLLVGCCLTLAALIAQAQGLTA